jgi:hypothetical protein
MAVTREEVVARLAGLVGAERATELVDEAIRSAGGLRGTWDDRTLGRVLEKLAATPGAVGAAARSLKRTSAGHARVDALDAITGEEPTGRFDESVVRKPEEQTGRVPSAPMRKLVTLLATALGQERSEALVDEALRKRGIRRDRVTRADALSVLDDLAKEEGAIGTVARFAKARALLEIQ